MPIPPLNAIGLLPAGIHDATLDAVRERFGAFHRSDRRVQLFSRLEQLLASLRRSKLFVAVIVDGSFVTAKPQPEDVDLIIILQRDHDWKADLGPSDYALVSRSALRRKFDFDVLLAADGGGDYDDTLNSLGGCATMSQLGKVS